MDNLFPNIRNSNIILTCDGWEAFLSDLSLKGWLITKHINIYKQGYIIQIRNPYKNIVCKGVLSYQDIAKFMNDSESCCLHISMKGFSGIRKNKSQKLENLTILETLQEINSTFKSARKSYINRVSTSNNIIDLEQFIKTLDKGNY